MKRWAVGTADETWKVVICARDANRISEVISHLIYRLTDAGNDEDAGLAQLRQMTGAQIIDGLIDVQRSALKSVERGMTKAEEAA